VRPPGLRRALTVLQQIEACIPALRRYAGALLRDRQDADDLVHDTLVRALDRLDSLRSTAEVRPWLFTIMHNLFVSQTRRARVRPDREPLDPDNTSGPSQPGAQEDGLRWRDLIRSLNNLPEEQREVILLISVEDLSYAEAARVLRVPVGTVMSRLSRGRERLRELTQGETRIPLRRVK
jgi:RNA polymerase sigma-70 factor (ECF subfamily)